MTKLTDTQARILNAASRRAGNLAMPLPKGLHGAVAKKVVGMMVALASIYKQTVDARGLDGGLHPMGAFQKTCPEIWTLLQDAQPISD